jgi:hypothetical protein
MKHSFPCANHCTGVEHGTRAVVRVRGVAIAGNDVVQVADVATNKRSRGVLNRRSVRSNFFDEDQLRISGILLQGRELWGEDEVSGTGRHTGSAWKKISLVSTIIDHPVQSSHSASQRRAISYLPHSSFRFGISFEHLPRIIPFSIRLLSAEESHSAVSTPYNVTLFLFKNSNSSLGSWGLTPRMICPS